MSVYWRNDELPQVASGAWSTPEGSAFACHVITADQREFTATVTFLGQRWTQKSTSPQGAVDGAARKAGVWLRDFSATAKWLSSLSETRPRGAPMGRYTVAKVPDSPEQEEWIRRKRNPAR